MKTKKCRKRKLAFSHGIFFVFLDALHPAGGRYAAVPAERSMVLEVHGAVPGCEVLFFIRFFDGDGIHAVIDATTGYIPGLGQHFER